jgi:hypothetical protein
MKMFDAIEDDKYPRDALRPSGQDVSDQEPPQAFVKRTPNQPHIRDFVRTCRSLLINRRDEQCGRETASDRDDQTDAHACGKPHGHDQCAA